jgi:hypothetical protein
MENRAKKLILAGAVAMAAATGVSAVIGTHQNDASLSSSGSVSAQRNPADPGAPQHNAGRGGTPDAQNGQKPAPKKPGSKKPAPKKPGSKKPAPKKPAPKKPALKPEKALPSGLTTATSFWDPGTASGKPMSFRTIASPYWPLGTKVKITYRGKSAIGVVDDFGPAEWAVAQHDIPAIVDLSETMMQSLTGVRSNTVHAHFQVLKFGDGPRYRTSGTGYGLAYGTGR